MGGHHLEATLPSFHRAGQSALDLAPQYEGFVSSLAASVVHFAQAAVLEHLKSDVGPANEFTVDEHLRHGREVRPSAHRGDGTGVVEDVHGSKRLVNLL